MIAGQKIALGRIHAGQVVTLHAAAETITIDLDGEDPAVHDEAVATQQQDLFACVVRDCCHGDAAQVARSAGQLGL